MATYGVQVLRGYELVTIGSGLTKERAEELAKQARAEKTTPVIYREIEA